MTSAEFILAGDFLLTMDAQNRVIPDGAVVLAGGRIRAVDRLDAIAAAHPRAAVRRVRNSVLMPGLINAHAHSGFLRGTAEHLPVWDWLTLHINPMHRVLQPHEAEAASFLCYAESVLGGTSTVVDMWRFMQGSAKAAVVIGSRLVAVPCVGEHPQYNYFDTLDMNEALIEAWHHKAGGRVNVWVGLEHPCYADEAGQRRCHRPFGTELRVLIRRMSVENPLWGAPRIHGELLKLGFELAQSSVAKYMVKRRGLPSQGWRTFLHNHAPDIATMDLFVVPAFVLIMTGLVVTVSEQEPSLIHPAAAFNLDPSAASLQCLHPDDKFVN
jgi:hypothetical protein